MDKSLRKRFFDAFRLCVDFFSFVNNAYGILPISDGTWRHVANRLEYVTEKLKVEIEDEVFEIVGLEAEGFMILLQQMTTEDRKKVLGSFLGQLSERLESLREASRSRSGYVNREKLEMFESVFLALTSAFKLGSSFMNEVSIGEETFCVCDWSELEELMFQKVR